MCPAPISSSPHAKALAALAVIHDMATAHLTPGDAPPFAKQFVDAFRTLRAIAQVAAPFVPDAEPK